MTTVNTLPFTPRSNVTTFSRPAGDPGLQPALSASLEQGFTGSFTGMGWRALKYWEMKNSATIRVDTLPKETLDQLFVGKEEWEQKYSHPGLKFEDNYNGRMVRKYAQELLNDTIRDELVSVRSATGRHTKTQLAGNLIGGFLSPVDWAIGMVTPEFLPLRFGLGGTVASRAGTGMARVFSRTVNGAINGAAQGVLAQPAIFALSEYNQTPYTLEDAMRGIAAGPLIGAAAGAASAGIRHFSGGGELDRHFANAVFEASMTDKDPGLAKKIAGLDPRVKAASDYRHRVTSAFEKIFDKAQRTADDLRDIAMMSGPGPDPDALSAGRIVRTREQLSRQAPRTREAVIVDMLDNPGSTNRDKIRLAANDDEAFLTEAWKTLFGQDLKFVDGGFADAMGFSGFVRGSDPATAYIRAGALHDRHSPVNSMIFLAGHELGHSIRRRDTKLWSDMVDAMMKTSQEDGGALSNAWALVARRNQEGGAWAGLSMNEKMEEAFANVIGQASLDSHFWRNLHASAPASATKLGSFIFGLRSRLTGLLNKNMTPSTKGLYEFLGSALMRADEDGRRLTDKLIADPASRDLAKGLYARHKPAFKEMTARMSAELNSLGTKQAEELAAFINWHNETFPQVASLVDESATPGKPGRYSSVLKGRRINSNNPGLWLLHAVYRKAKPGTKEYQAWTDFAQKRLAWSERDGVTATGAKDYTNAAMRAGPLAEFKKNPDGTWDIGILRDDSFPRWTELFDDLPSGTELRAQAYLHDQLEQVSEAFRQLVAGDKITTRRDDTELLHRFLIQMDESEMDELMLKDPDALWQAFGEHIDERLSHYRLAEDPEAYKNLAEVRTMLDGLTVEKEGGTGPDPKALKSAWEKFHKEYPKIKETLDPRENVPLTPQEGQPPDEFFKELHARTVEEISHEISELTDGMRGLQLSRDGKALEFTLAKAMMGDEEFGKRLTKAIEEMAHDRIRDSGQWPQYDRVMGLMKAVKDEAPQVISLDGVRKSELPPGYRDLDTDLDDRAVDFDEVFDYMASTPEEVHGEAQSRRISLDEANRLAIERLKKEHGDWQAWSRDYETSADARITEWAEELGVPGYKFSAWDVKPEKAGEGEGPKITNAELHSELEKIRKTYFAVVNALDKHRRGREVDVEKFYIADALERVEHHTRQGNDPDRAARLAQIDMQRDYQSKALQELNNHQARATLSAKRRTGLDSLYSYLDGSARRNVKGAGYSVDAAMHARLTQDTAAFETALQRTGLAPLFKENSEPLMRQLILEMKGIESGSPAVKELAAVLRQTQDTQVGRLNARGANIRPLDGYVFSQVHSAEAIKADPQRFMASLNEWIDWETTSRIVGPNTEDGKFSRQTYLEQLAFELSKTDREASPDFDPVRMGGNTANKVSHRRTLYFKDTYAFDYDMAFGSGNTAGLITAQMMKRAEMATVMEHFGSDYKKVWNSVMSDAQGAGKWMFNKLNRIDTTFRSLTGDLNHPVDVPLADKGRAVRNYMNSVALWMSSVSSLTDLGNMTATARWAGLNPKDIHGKFLDAVKQHATDTKDREFLLAQGAGLQAVLNGFSEMTTMRGPFYRFASAASDFTFKYNGLEFTTRVFQSAFHDVMTQHLGSMSGAKMTPEFRNWLAHYEITADEWKMLSKHAAEIDGLGGVRLAPDMIPDSPAAQKLRIALIDSVNQAVLQPSASDKALLTGGFKAGTVAGEAFRTVMQYKSYPLAMIRKVNRRFNNAYGSQGFDLVNPSLNRGTTDKLVWATSMIGLAATVLSIKDLLRGREPMNPFDSEQWNLRNASRLTVQAGIGPFAVAEQFMSARQLAGPALGTIGSLVTANTGYSRTNAVVGALPGASLAPLRETSKAVLGSIFSDTYGSQYQLFLRRNEAETGQSSIFQVDNTGSDQ